MRRAALLAVAACALGACASAAPPALQGPRPARVVLLAASSAQRPAARSATADFLGEQAPEEVLAQEARLALRQHGYEVLEARVGRGAADAAQGAALAREHRAEAAWLLTLTRMELDALAPQGRARFDFALELVSADGRRLWQHARSTPTSVKLYRAQSDWRSHLRQAVSETVRSLP